jgi:serine/threonine-protein kinase RsbW
MHNEGTNVDSQALSPQPTGGLDRIELSFPARAEYIAVARLATAGVAGRMEFSFDDIEDLKIAVGEACTAAILAGAPSLRLVYEIAADRVTIYLTHDDTGRKPADQSELGMFLLNCLVDEVRSEADGARHVTCMTKLLHK